MWPEETIRADCTRRGPTHRVLPRCAEKAGSHACAAQVGVEAPNGCHEHKKQWPPQTGDAQERHACARVGSTVAASSRQTPEVLLTLPESQ
eukprot:6245757-Prymnesium_polylepis.1